jgi:hypothetical protein
VQRTDHPLRPDGPKSAQLLDMCRAVPPPPSCVGSAQAVVARGAPGGPVHQEGEDIPDDCQQHGRCHSSCLRILERPQGSGKEFLTHELLHARTIQSVIICNQLGQATAEDLRR